VPWTITPALPDWKPADDPDEAGPYNNLPPPPNQQQQVRCSVCLTVSAAYWPSSLQSWQGVQGLLTVTRLPVLGYIPAASTQLLPCCMAQAGATARMTHSDKVGDPVCMEEARWVLNVLYDALAGQVSPRTFRFCGHLPMQRALSRTMCACYLQLW
jgi:hypothetical protein